MKNNRVLFIGDGGDASILSQCCNEDLVIIDYIHPLPLSIGRLKRHIGYLGLAWHAFRNRRKAHYILFWQQFVAIYYLFFSFFIPWNKKPVLIYYIIYKPNSLRLIECIKRKVISAIINNHQVKVVYFVSQLDKLYPLINDSKRRLLSDHPFHSQLIENNILNINNEDYFFSGGASNRSYPVIRELAELMPDFKFKIACLPDQALAIMPSLPNLQVHVNVSNAEFEYLLMRSIALIIPLEKSDIVSGQLVSLAAMQSGKPIFITRNRFVGEWFNTNTTDSFLHFFDTSRDLFEQLKVESDDSLKIKGSAARQFYLTNHDELNVYNVFKEDIKKLMLIS
jgi:hypothetical protein